MRTSRLLALLIFALLLASCAVSYPSQIEAIDGTDSLNQLTADSAPQQTVVNGWTARDYLQLTSWQGTEQSILLYAVVALLVIVAALLFAQNRRLGRLVALSEAVGAPMPDTTAPASPPSVSAG